MNIIKTLELEKYKEKEKYTQIGDSIYKDSTGGIAGKMGISDEVVYCITLYCELEDDEDTQYPLEDILDKYHVNCTDVMEEKEEAGKRIYIVEIEGEQLDNIREIEKLVGKRVFNYEDGDYIELGIE